MRNSLTSWRLRTAAETAAKLRSLGRADRVIDDPLTRVERISESFEVGVAKPRREIHAVTADLRSALGVFFDQDSTVPAGAPRNAESGPWRQKGMAGGG